MISYDPIQRSPVLYQEDGYRVVASPSHVTIYKAQYARASSCLRIEEIPFELKKRLQAKGEDPNNYFYVPFILIKAEALHAFEAYAASLAEYQRQNYVRSVLPRKC